LILKKKNGTCLPNYHGYYASTSLIMVVNKKEKFFDYVKVLPLNTKDKNLKSFFKKKWGN